MNQLLVVPLLAAMFVGSAIGITSVPVVAGSPLHYASGGGFFAAPEGATGEINDFMFAFTARQLDAPGNAEGQFQHQNLTKGHWLHLDIIYMKVVGDDVWLGGVVTESNHLRPGETRIVRLRDNGEEHTAPHADMRSKLSNQPAGNALSSPNLALFDLDGGNIQIR